MNTRVLGRLAAAVVLAVLLAGCGGGDDTNESAQATAAAPAAPTAVAAATAAPTPAGPQVLEVKAGDYYFEPKDLTVKPGAVVIKLSNAGPERQHTFHVRNKSGDGDLAKSERLDVGASGTVEFTLTEAGTYEIYCSLRGHADRGQKGTLTVQGTPAS